MTIKQTQSTRKGGGIADLLGSWMAGVTLAVGSAAAAAALLIGGAFILVAVTAMLGLMKYLVWPLVIGAVIGIWIYFTDDGEQTPVRDVLRPTGSVFGDAGWAYLEEVQRAKLIPDSSDWAGAIWLGRPINVEMSAQLYHPYRDTALAFRGETNIVTFSSAGGGKNAAAITPTLLVNDENAYVNDMKGESWFTTARTRKEVMGHRIVLLNAFNLYGKELGFDEPMTSHYNPLGNLRPDGDGFVSRLNAIAAACIIFSGHGDPHWTDRGKQLVAGICGELCSNPVYYEKGENTLPMMYRIASQPGDQLAAWCRQAAENSTVPIVREYLGSFGEPSKEVDGIVSTVLGQLNFLTEPALIDFLSRSDFDPADLRREKMTVYCMMPPAMMDVYYRFMRVMVQAVFDTLSSSPITERAPVLMLLDEQAKLGGMDIIKTSAATLRSYKVRIWSVFQDMNQLKALYPDAWETFIANAGLVQVMTVNDRVTAEYFSEKIGRRGVKVTSQSEGQSRSMQGPAHGSTNTGQSTSEQPVLFFSPQDFYNLPADRSIVFAQGMAYPILTERLEYWRQTDKYGAPNAFQPWGTGAGIPYTPNPEYDPSVLAAERQRLQRERSAP
jgi:type IV secretion system protein VirD4